MSHCAGDAGHEYADAASGLRSEDKPEGGAMRVETPTTQHL